jgi:site-specific DNA-cytosine methylase
VKRRRTAEERKRRHLYGDSGASFSKGKEMYMGRDGIMNTITTVTSKDNLIVDMATQEKKKCPRVYGFYEMEPDEKALANKPKGRGWRYVMAEKGPAWVRIRKLTPRECFRLMDVDEDKIDRLLNAGISDSQLYKLAGNSIVVSCMEGIFYNAFCEEEKEQAFGQLSLF